MARPIKPGLDYFPLDWDIDEDDKICLIAAEVGELAFGRLIKLLAKIYHDGGYYKKWDEETEMLFATRKGIPLEELRILIHTALKRDIFDPGIYGKYRILTSAGIQKRYIEVVKKRKEVFIISELYLLGNKPPINDRITLINAPETLVNSTFSTQRKEKKSRVKKSIISSDKGVNSPQTSSPNSSPATPAINNNRSIYHLIEQAFLSKNQDFDYGREGPHIVKLEKKALARPDPEEFIKKAIVVFWDLTRSNDNLFKDQPFLPSILDSSGMWPRVMKRIEQLEGQEIDPDTEHFLDNLFKEKKA